MRDLIRDVINYRALRFDMATCSVA